MNTFTRKFAMTGAALAAAGFIAFGETESASAATTWEARTVEEITADLQAAESGETSYTITWGDTLSSIASALGVNVNKLSEVNDINNADLIITGTTLSISPDHGTVTYSEPTGEVKSYDVSEESEQVQEVETPVEVKEEVVEEPVVEEPVVEEPVEQPTQAPVEETSYSSNLSVSEAEAKEIIAQRESSGSYTAVNGQYYGRYQLNPTLVHHGASPAEQEIAADNYVAGRYGSWTAALEFWNNNGWY